MKIVMSDSWRICKTCGRELGVAKGKSLAEALFGWYVVSTIKDPESFDRIIFCSMDCLSRWVQGRRTAVPEAFRRAIDHEVIS